jgi:hypothetical protein
VTLTLPVAVEAYGTKPIRLRENEKEGGAKIRREQDAVLFAQIGIWRFDYG